MDILEHSNYKYLAAEAFEDLFGSEDTDLVNKMLSRLRDKKPDTYNWTYDLIIQGDTVILTSKDRINELATVKNEVTATLTLNNFEAVTFRFDDEYATWTIGDLTLPYFDLISEQPKTSGPEQGPESLGTDPTVMVDPPPLNDMETNGAPDEEDNPLTMWLVISGMLNIGLIGLLTRKSRNS